MRQDATVAVTVKGLERAEAKETEVEVGVEVKVGVAVETERAVAERTEGLEGWG